MTATKAIEQIYNLLAKELSPLEATEGVAAILSIVIDELVEEGLEVNEENLNERLMLSYSEFKSAASKSVD
jgi:hypothetical protein